jgi:TetR/AcrR family transcriptional regulator, transcriptional repressor for nem operon
VTLVQSTRERLISAAAEVIRVKGYAATSVNDIASAAGVTKGSFFHHFATKEACAREAAVYWKEKSRADAAVSSQKASTPKERILAYIDFRISLLAGPVAKYACYVGTVLHEVHDTHPELAADVAASLMDQAQALEPDLAAALGAKRREAHDLAVHIEAAIQGALLLTKAQGGTDGARASLRYLKNFIELKLQGAKK